VDNLCGWQRGVGRVGNKDVLQARLSSDDGVTCEEAARRKGMRDASYFDARGERAVCAVRVLTGEAVVAVTLAGE